MIKFHIMETHDTGCCPRFNPEPWHDKMLEWNNKKFIKDKVRTLWYIPLNFGGAMTRLITKVDVSGAESVDLMALSDHTSKWNMDIYLAVDREIPGAVNAEVTGNFYSRVYEGNFKDTALWHKDFSTESSAKGYKTGKRYMWYTTCPKCAKAYGKNYVVIIAEVTSKK